MKITVYNDTKRTMHVHPATFFHGCKGESAPIEHVEEREFTLPANTEPWVKMWDYGPEKGLQILVSPNEIQPKAVDMNRDETSRLIALLQQREEMSGLGSDEAEELLVLLQKSTEHIAHWIASYPREDKKD